MATLIVAAAALALCAPAAVLAQNPPPVQTFYVPGPEDQVFDALESTYPGNATCGGGSSEVASPISTTISIAVAFGGTYIYYDQWEDGSYDADIANPVNLYSSPGNLGGTQIWGDGDTTNGSAPGYPGDVFSAGDIVVLENDVPTGALTTIDFDGRDKIAASSPIAVTRAAWSTGPSTLLAGAVEVFSTAEWGTVYEAPVGEDTTAQLDMFEYTGLVIMAGTDGTTVDIDADANGIAEISIMLDAGESYHVDGGVDEGATVTATSPVQVDLLTGDICATYESRWFALLPTDMWSDSAFTPVGTNTGDPTYVFVHNPGPGSITVMWETDAGAQPSFVVAAGGTGQVTMPDGSGAHFFTTDTSPFFAVSTVDSEPIGGNQAHDWGFSMIPESSLTQQALVGWGPGKDPTAGGTENGSPVWVTPVLETGTSPVDICVDFDGDNAGPLTDSFGNNYDLLVTLDELDAAKVFDTDGDQTGMILYVCDGSDALIAVAWGQDPDTASGGSPAIDVGTTVPPLDPLAAAKGVSIETDVDLDGEIDQGDTLEYEIVIQNVSRVPVTPIVVTDTVPALTTYVTSSTELFDGVITTPIADSGATDFPLDEGGFALPSLPPGGEFIVTFLVTVDSTADVCGAGTLVNQATINGAGQLIPAEITSSAFCNPDVVIEKATNGVDADTPTGPTVLDASTVTWTYVVTNPGDTPLGSVVVIDDQGVTVVSDDVNIDTFNDGDLDLDGLLDPGEIWTYTATGAATLGQYANIGTVTGTPVDEGGTPVTDGDGTPFADETDDDPSHYLAVTCIVDGDCADGVGCTVDTCVLGSCVFTPDNSSCDDGLFCNGDETCDDTLDCLPGTAPCTGGLQCDEVNDVCSDCLVDADCTDPLACNGTETCVGGVCQPGTPVDCDDAVGCTTDVCQEPSGTCVNTPVDSACDDGEFCNGVETCDPVFGCESGATVDCSGTVGECGDGFCNEVTDACDAIPNDSLCDDTLFCNGVETCDLTNTCQAGAPIDCSDAVTCTVDTCDDVNDTCVNTPDDSICDDGLFCNGNETCDATLDCQAAAAPNCDDGVGCTDDSCDEANDTCLNNPIDALCDDGAACNGLETCDPTQDCQAGPPVDCNDAVTCTTDACVEPAGTCTNTPDDSVCSDGEFCNGDETCDPLLDCQAGTPPDCSDGVTCTSDLCDEANDTCTNTPSDALCDDGQFCTGVEICDPLLDCQAGTPIVCDDGFDCSTDTCDDVIDMCVFDESSCICGDGLPAPGEQCDPPGSLGGDPACGDDCLFICGNGVVGDVICREGMVGVPCTTNADCDIMPGDGLCLPEECDPPGAETCNNGQDDDGDLLIDCADPDCQSGLPTCGVACQLVPPCGCIRRDPALIKFNTLPKLDFFKLHGRVPIDPLSIVVEDVGFAIILSNANGTIYEATVPPAELLDKPPKQRWKFKDNDAKPGLDPAGPHKGLARVRMKVRQIDGVDFLTFAIKAYGDFSAATLPHMTSQVYMAGEVSSLAASWDQRNNGWRLRLKDFPPCAGP